MGKFGRLLIVGGDNKLIEIHHFTVILGQGSRANSRGVGRFWVGRAKMSSKFSLGESSTYKDSSSSGRYTDLS